MTTPNKQTESIRHVPARYTRWGSVLLSLDFLTAVPLGAALALFVDLSGAVQASIRTALLFAAPAGLALGGLMMGAASLLPGLMDSNYRFLIEQTPDGMQGVIRPFKITARIAFATSVTGLIAVVIWPAIADGPDALLAGVAGIPLFLFLWTALGASQLVGQSLFHFESKSELQRVVTLVKEQQHAS